jgi:hypothetical protein
MVMEQRQSPENNNSSQSNSSWRVTNYFWNSVFYIYDSLDNLNQILSDLTQELNRLFEENPHLQTVLRGISFAGLTALAFTSGPEIENFLKKLEKYHIHLSSSLTRRLINLPIFFITAITAVFSEFSRLRHLEHREAKDIENHHQQETTAAHQERHAEVVRIEQTNTFIRANRTAQLFTTTLHTNTNPSFFNDPILKTSAPSIAYESKESKSESLYERHPRAGITLIGISSLGMVGLWQLYSGTTQFIAQGISHCFIQISPQTLHQIIVVLGTATTAWLIGNGLHESLPSDAPVRHRQEMKNLEQKRQQIEAKDSENTQRLLLEHKELQSPSSSSTTTMSTPSNSQDSLVVLPAQKPRRGSEEDDSPVRRPR